MSETLKMDHDIYEYFSIDQYLILFTLRSAGESDPEGKTFVYLSRHRREERLRGIVISRNPVKNCVTRAAPVNYLKRVDAIALRFSGGSCRIARWSHYRDTCILRYYVNPRIA